MAISLTGETLRVINVSGGTLPAGALVAIVGFHVPSSTITIDEAQANGANRRADLILSTTVVNGQVGYGRRDHVLENQNTAGRAVEDPVYLSPTVAGGYTFTKPTGASQDVQEVGQVLTVDAAAGRILFQLQGGGARGLGPDSLSSALLTDKMLRDIGQAGVGWVQMLGAMNDGDRITIDGRIYEFDVAGPFPTLVVGAHVGIDQTGVNNANTAATNAAAAINGDANRTVDALVVGNDTVALVDRTPSAAAITLAESTVTARMLTSGVTLTGSAVPATQQYLTRRYNITVADVACLATVPGTNEVCIGCFPATTLPQLHNAKGWINATNSTQLLDGSSLTLRQINATYWGLFYAEPAGGALFVAGDSISFAISVAG
jgi:hypothetical protein